MMHQCRKCGEIFRSKAKKPKVCINCDARLGIRKRYLLKEGDFPSTGV